MLAGRNRTHRRRWTVHIILLRRDGIAAWTPAARRRPSGYWRRDGAAGQVDFARADLDVFEHELRIIVLRIGLGERDQRDRVAFRLGPADQQVPAADRLRDPVEQLLEGQRHQSGVCPTDAHGQRVGLVRQTHLERQADDTGERVTRVAAGDLQSAGQERHARVLHVRRQERVGISPADPRPTSH